MAKVRKRPTSADVAALAGVSRTTVSFVLNSRADVQISPETRQRVIDAAEQLGYHPSAPAVQLASGASMTLALVLRQSPEQVAVDALLSETLRGIATAGRAAGYRILVEPLPPESVSYGDLLRTQRADGLIISGPRVDDVALSDLIRHGFPVVLQGSLPSVDAASVDIDNRAGARQAVELLIGLGHRRIACITNAPLAYTSAAERVAGYRDALETAGLPFEADLVVEGAFDPASGHVAMETLMRRPAACKAVFVASDVVALGAIGALRAAGMRVPKDVSIVGFDDIPLAAYFDPPLTTVRLPAYDLGHAAGQALIDRVAGRPVPPRTLLPTELIVRASTAPPSAGTTTGDPAAHS